LKRDRDCRTSININIVLDNVFLLMA